MFSYSVNNAIFVVVLDEKRWWRWWRWCLIQNPVINKIKHDQKKSQQETRIKNVINLLHDKKAEQ